MTEVDLREGRAETTAVTRRAHEIGLLMNPQARVTGGPLIASHVGADAAADLIAQYVQPPAGTYPFSFELAVDPTIKVEAVLTAQ